jgi:hypothetical protein
MCSLEATFCTSIYKGILYYMIGTISLGHSSCYITHANLANSKLSESFLILVR